MGITPIGPLAMLPVSRTAESEVEPVRMGMVERSARTEDETYSSSRDDGDSQSESQESGSEAQSYKYREEGQAGEAESSSTEPSAGAAPSFDRASDLASDDSTKISFFA